MPSQENMNTVRKLFECLNSNNPNTLNSMDACCSADMKFHDPASTPTSAKSGLEAMKQAESTYIKAFPNKSVKIDSILGSEDQVVVRWTATGAHKGPYQNIAPTNKQFKISGITIYRLANNKITDLWQIWDHYGLVEQLGELKLAKASR